MYVHWLFMKIAVRYFINEKKKTSKIQVIRKDLQQIIVFLFNIYML